tara:strand:+ start:773 stop:2356 length:1584 start_codon:yes stop_codon:yes gene_type:complete
MIFNFHNLSDEQIAKELMDKYQRAKTVRDQFVPLFEECYEFSMPQRESFYTESIGQRRDEKIFDETAVVGVQEFASRLQQGLVPNFARWADFIAGSEVPKDQREAVNNDLDEVTEYVFEILQNSNFGQEVHESFMDLAVGTGVLHVTEGDAVQPIVFSAIPLPHVVLDTGPDDKIDHVYRERNVRYSHIPLLYPNGNFSKQLMDKMQQTPDAKTKILEVVCKDYSKLNQDAHFDYVVDCESKTLIRNNSFDGVGSNPYICFRWSKCSGEIYGRGPLMNALSAVKTTNLTMQLVLENAQMAISGIYQLDDDGIVNPDTISLVPGTVIPKAPNSAGLQPIRAAGNFDVSQFIFSEMRMNIKKALYNEMLGDPNKTPATATEIAERMADLSRQIGSAFGRLQSEMVQPVLQRVVHILRKQGRIEIPTVNGRQVKVRSSSPLSQAQSRQDISSTTQWLQVVQQGFGPEIMNLLVSGEEVATYLAKKYGVPDSLIRDANERQQITQIMQQAQMMQQTQMQQAQQQGEEVATQ